MNMLGDGPELSVGDFAKAISTLKVGHQETPSFRPVESFQDFLKTHAKVRGSDGLYHQFSFEYR